MLRLSYRGRKTVFDYTRIKKADIKKVIAGHLRQWGREQVKEGNGLPSTRVLPPDGWTAAWQDGDAWADDAPTEAVPVT